MAAEITSFQGRHPEDHRPDAAVTKTSGKDGDGGLAHGGEHQNEQERHQHQHADMAGAEQAVGEDLHGGEVNIARGVAHPQQPYTTMEMSEAGMVT